MLLHAKSHLFDLAIKERKVLLAVKVVRVRLAFRGHRAFRV
jgi:hypothetical protein